MTHVSELHHEEHREWMSLLDFYHDEIRIFQNELTVVAACHPNLPSIEGQVAEYRHLLLHKLSRMDAFRESISRHDYAIQHQLGFNPDDGHNHHDLRESIEQFKRDFEELKQRFRRFAAYND